MHIRELVGDDEGFAKDVDVGTNQEEVDEQEEQQQKQKKRRTTEEYLHNQRVSHTEKRREYCKWLCCVNRLKSDSSEQH